MNDIVKSYQEQFRRSRHTFRRYAAFLLALAMITTLFVNWQLHGVGISMTADYQCGEQEHTHTASCYEKVLVCGYTEGEPEDWNATMPSDDMVIDSGFAVDSSFGVDSEVSTYTAEPQVEWVPHTHTDDCYTEVQTLTCMEEEHVHDDSCFDPEDGSLICNLFEHTHDDSCYTTSYELTCGLQEGELVEQVVEADPDAAVFDAVSPLPVVVDTAPVVVDTTDVSDTPVHHHTEDCYEEVLVCPFPEHHHTVECLSDPLADVEYEEDWLAKTDTTLDGLWSDDLINVAKSQLGYEQSEKNFQLDTDDGITFRYYTRYGQWYGNPYGEWDVMFLSYCLHYANIPQTAVPQRAGVLALRSDMRDMAWFQDVDGTNVTFQDIAPGDIVIYRTTVTESAVWEDKAASSDSSSSGDDSGIAVFPADISSAKPVVVDPSFTAPTAPTPVTTTYTEDIDTVGIVTAVDEEAKTLTVISGDVNGKVAEREVNAYAVESLIGVTAAQQVLSGGGTTTLVSANLDESWISNTTITLNGKTYKVKGDSSYDSLPGGLTVTDNDNVNLHYEFNIAEGQLASGTDTLTYDLPKGFISLKNGTSGNLLNEKSEKIGTITVDANGKATLKFDKALTGQISGHFDISCRVDESKTDNTSKIQFPGSSETIEIKSKTDLKVWKTVDKDQPIKRNDNGKYVVHYKVTVKSPDYGSGESIDLRDVLTSYDSNAFANIKYTNVTLKKGGSAYPNDYTVEQITENGKPGIHIKDTITSDGKLPALSKGESYVLEYDLEVDKLTQGWAQLGNTAYANNEPGSKTVDFQNEMTKNGSYDAATGKITWTIEILPNGGSINGFTLSDTLPNGLTMNGDFTVVDNEGNVLINLSDFEQGKNSFTYTFPDKGFKDKTSYKYIVTFTTNAPTGFQVGNSVNNTATIKLKDGMNNDKPWSADGDAHYNNRDKTVEKKATASTTLDKSQMDENGVFTLPWSLDVQLPYNSWNTKGVIEITDKIRKPDKGDHYAIQSKLDAEIKQNLTITVDGKTYTYAELPTDKLTLEIQYFSNESCSSGSRIKTPTGTEQVRGFKLHFVKAADCSLDAVSISDYTTKASYDDTLNEGETIYFRNEVDNEKPEYKFTLPASDSTGLVKMSAAKPGPAYDTEDGGSYQPGNDVEIPYGNGYIDQSGNKVADGTYIYYQLELKPGLLQNWTGATVTDTLPDGVTYVDGSAFVVIRHGNSDMYTEGSTWRKYRTACIWRDPDYHYSSLSTSDFFSVTQKNNGKMLEFGLTDKFKYLSDDPKAELVDRIYIRYAVRVDTAWDLTKDTEVKVFPNSASWGDSTSTTETTVKRTATLVTKEGEYEDDRAKYSIIINPEALTLGNSENIELVDDMKADGGTENTAELVRSSVKLYDYDAATKTTGALIPSDAYTVSYEETEVAHRNHYILKVTVPNGHSYLLEYEYLNTSNTQYQMQNTATLYGQTTEVVKTNTQVSTAHGGAHTVGLTVHKVDSRNVTVPLEGAEFKLEWFDPSDGTYKDVYDGTGIQLLTDANGDLNFSFSDTGGYPRTDGPDKVFRPYNVLYKLTELHAPEGYHIDDTFAYYFIWTTNSNNADDAYQNAVGTTYADNIGIAKDKIHYHYSNSAIYLTVENDSSRLTIQKLWEDKYGHAVDGSNVAPDSIELKLMRRATKDSTTPAEYVDTIYLRKSEGWKAYYTIPDDAYRDYYYYVEEVSTGNQYDVTILGNGVQNSGTIVLTNREKDRDGFELPSTGGAGTTLYTAAGGTLMLAALVCGVRRKRRSEGRADK